MHNRRLRREILLYSKGFAECVKPRAGYNAFFDFVNSGEKHIEKNYSVCGTMAVMLALTVAFCASGQTTGQEAGMAEPVSPA